MKTILLFFLGASLASFLGLVVDRFPEQSIVFPASHCGHCKRQLAIRDLVPVISQVINKSSCRFCGQSFPIWYGIFECLTGLAVVLTNWVFLTWEQLFLLLLASTLSIFDLKHQSFPLLVWLLASLPCLFFVPFNTTCLILLLLAIVAELIDLKIGSGDFAFLASLSLFCDLMSLVWIVELGAVIGIIACLVFKVKRLPFVPCLSLGYFLLILAEHFC